MKIKAKASGGIAGRTDCVEMDTACTATGQAVEKLLHELDFFGATPASGTGFDIRRWDITVDDGQRQRTVTVMEDGSSGGPGWQALLAHLRNAA